MKRPAKFSCPVCGKEKGMSVCYEDKGVFDPKHVLCRTCDQVIPTSKELQFALEEAVAAGANQARKEIRNSLGLQE